MHHNLILLISKVKNITPQLTIENRIVNLLHTTDKEAITLIFENYGGLLLNIIMRVVKNEPLAQEAFQDALLKIWKNGASYSSDKGSLFTWMARICRNTAIDRTRTKDFKQLQKSRDAVDVVSISETQSEDGGIESQYLRQLVEELPENQRILIDLAYFQGYTQQEIAKKLEIPLGTVKSRIRLGIKYLRSII